MIERIVEEPKRLDRIFEFTERGYYGPEFEIIKIEADRRTPLVTSEVNLDPSIENPGYRLELNFPASPKHLLICIERCFSALEQSDTLSSDSGNSNPIEVKLAYVIGSEPYTVDNQYGSFQDFQRVADLLDDEEITSIRIKSVYGDFDITPGHPDYSMHYSGRTDSIEPLGKLIEEASDGKVTHEEAFGIIERTVFVKKNRSSIFTQA